MYIYIQINIYRYKNKYIYIYIYNIFINKLQYKSKNNILFIKDAHPNPALDACPETSVRVCFGGINSRFTFPDFESILAFWVFL